LFEGKKFGRGTCRRIGAMHNRMCPVESFHFFIMHLITSRWNFPAF
jgi:hypothetical protein